MRRGVNGADVHRLGDGSIFGVNLGADYTAEHEMGTKPLSRAFALDATASPGVPRRTIRVLPSGRTLGDGLSGLVLVTRKHDRRKHRWDPIKGESYIVAYTPYGHIDEDETRFYVTSETEIVGAWSETDFAVHFRPEHKQDAQDLYDAFQRLDVAFLFGNVGNNPFARAGLCLTIVSRLPHEIVEDLAKQDADHDALLAAAEATGIEAEIESANAEARARRAYPLPFGYYALRPRWRDGSKSEVVFWLNPHSQDRNNFGWFTAEDLRNWLRGAGPIPKAQ